MRGITAALTILILGFLATWSASAGTSLQYDEQTTPAVRDGTWLATAIYDFNISEYTGDPNDPIMCGGVNQQHTDTLWIALKGVSARVRINTALSGYDTVVAVWPSNNAYAITGPYIACNDDIGPSQGSQVEFNAVATKTYLIELAEFGQDNQAGGLRVRAMAICDGLEATIYGDRLANARPDGISGTAGNDVIVGLGGDDTIDGKGGDDTICGNAGGDTLSGGPNNDTLDGSSGNDTAHGQGGADVALGGAGNDTLTGGTGNDQLEGGPGSDDMNGGPDTDTCFGGSGTDTAAPSCEATPGVP
ncbi:MAG: calcium-binding protein [Dehalococcoidia bacterium]